jgi:hypothetical protein
MARTNIYRQLYTHKLQQRSTERVTETIHFPLAANIMSKTVTVEKNEKTPFSFCF